MEIASIITGAVAGLLTGSLITTMIIKTVVFKKVKNTNPAPSADKEYWLLQDNNKSYLFTQEQVDIAEHRAERNPEDAVS